MSNLIYGIDISNNNGSVDFAKVKRAGKEYVYVKATEGQSFKDKWMETFLSGCKSNGLKCGAYHFLVGTSTPEAQAKNFYEKIKDSKFDLAPALDVENNFNGLDNYVQRFVSEFAKYSDQKLILYTYTSFISLMKGSLSMFKKAWIANYNYKDDLASVAHSLLTSNGITIVGHQYYGDSGRNGHCDGVNGACDLDVFTTDILLSSNTTIPGKWILQDSKWWYKHSDGTYTKDGWEYIEGKWYMFDKEGWMLFSWQRKDGNWYFLGDANDGSMKSGWAFDKEYNRWFFMNENGEMQTGWIKDENEWYYLQPKTCTEVVNGKEYKYTAGEMRTGWIKDGQYDYCLYSSGKMIHDCEAYGYKFNSKGQATKL